MKNIVECRNGRATVQPLECAKEALLSVKSWTGDLAAVSLDVQGAYVLGNALLRWSKSIDQKTFDALRALAPVGGVRCHGDACAAGQVKCPTPGVCGVAS